MKWENSTIISAPTARVWRLTIDLPNLPSITPTMRSVRRLDDGPVAIGSRARITQPGQASAVWTVTRIDEGREFVWETRRVWMKLVGGHHIERLDDGSCRNLLSVELTGVGSSVFGTLLSGMVRKSIAAENAGIKAAAEAGR